jgi:hypothetical protein
MKEQVRSDFSSLIANICWEAVRGDWKMSSRIELTEMGAKTSFCSEDGESP